MAKHPTLLEHFRAFCYQNSATDFERAVEYFAVFGGMGWKVDMEVPLEQLIEEKVLRNYRYIHADIAKITQSDRNHHAVLSGIALGDRREHTAFKRANVSREEGEASIDFLVENDLLVCERSQAEPLNAHEEVSAKCMITLPFLRFWFSSVSPYYKGIRDGDYSEFKKHWENSRHGFSDLIYDQLVKELIKLRFEEDPIAEIGAYWDKNNEIDLLAKTKSGKILAGMNRYSKSKLKKSALNSLKEVCSKVKLEPDIYVLFSKNGFSSELKKEKGERLRLLELKHLRVLMSELSEKDKLSYSNKKY